jgi:peptidoglycan/xylan/chitin deacetylase (PgdA/CDA1 family)
MSIIVKAGKVIKRNIKKYCKGRENSPMSYVRRIDRVATEERVCAMTFDDGPFGLPASPDHFSRKALSDILLDTLAAYGARGTFDVIGDTSANYPDKAGKLRTPQWGGIRYDHYPDIFADQWGGAVHQPQLIERMLKENHEISSHGYRHLIFGQKKLVYGRREYFKGIDEVVEDLQKLHYYLKDNFGYDIKLARPPHYVDNISAGLTSFDAYQIMGYQYVGASFDGAGWLPRGDSYEQEVTDTYLPMEEALQKDPNALCGQIIFQKDGYNMAKRTPVADGLEYQLSLLQKYGYRVIPVSELLNHSQTSDLKTGSPYFASVSKLLDAGICTLYKDNTFGSDKILTRGEFAMFMSNYDLLTERVWMIKKDSSFKIFADVPVVHPYSTAIDDCVKQGLLEPLGNKILPDAVIDPQLVVRALNKIGKPIDSITAPYLTRGDFSVILSDRL